MKFDSLSKIALLLIAALFATAAYGQHEKPLSIVVGYAPGGSADFVARLVGTAMAMRLGRQVSVENVTGESGMLAAQRVLRAPANGDTIYMGGTDTVVVPMVTRKAKPNWERDFQPIGRMTTIPMVFAVPSSSPYATLDDLGSALHSKGKETAFSYATPGAGTMQHLYGELISKQAKISMAHVPYRGGSQIADDLVGRQIDSAILVLSTALPLLREGKIKALSVSDATRVLLGVRNIGEEEGFNGVTLPLWQGLFVRAGTPASIVQSYEKTLRDVLARGDIRAKLLVSGINVAPLSGKDFRGFIRTQSIIYRDIVESAGIRGN